MTVPPSVPPSATEANERFSLPPGGTLAALGDLIGSTYSSISITGVARYGHAGKGDLCFCDRMPGPDLLARSTGSVVLCTEDLLDSLREGNPHAVYVPVTDPRAVFIDFCQDALRRNEVAVSNKIPRPFGIHGSARIGPNTIVHPEARVDEDVVIGANCVIHRGTWIQEGARVADNTVIGVDGINAYRGADGKVRGFPHAAGVIIGQRVTIGAGAVIVRGILNSTRIGNDTVIGNLCNIGHVVDIGEHVWISVGGLVGGHTRIEDRATLGMGVVVRDNVVIGGRAQVGMASVVVKDVKQGASVFGNPARVVAAIEAGPER